MLLEMNEALQQGSDMVCQKQKNPFMLFPSWSSENNPYGESRSSPMAAPALLLHYFNTWGLIPDLINVTGLKCMSLPLEYQQLMSLVIHRSLQKKRRVRSDILSKKLKYFHCHNPHNENSGYYATRNNFTLTQSTQKLNIKMTLKKQVMCF